MKTGGGGESVEALQSSYLSLKPCRNRQLHKQDLPNRVGWESCMVEMGWIGNSERRAEESVVALQGFGVSLKKCYDRREK
jgi:hypothetical protein